MNGMIYLTTPSFTVGLIVKDGIVVDAPPIARRWTVGRNARLVWQHAARRGARLAWMPDTDMVRMRAGSDPDRSHIGPDDQGGGVSPGESGD